MEPDAIKMFETIIGAGVVTSLATNFLKSPLVKIPFNKYKRMTALGVSIISTFIALHQQGVRDFSADWRYNTVVLIGVFITSAITYNNVLKQKDKPPVVINQEVIEFEPEVKENNIDTPKDNMLY
jgi:uncharacterized membrane protein (DUF441 family)